MAGSRIAQNAQLKLSTQSTQSSPTRATRSRRGRQGRLRRWGRRLGIALLALLVVIGAVSVWRFVAGPPGVGHFADAEARARYVTAYDAAMTALPTPTATHDVRTDLGVVRVYEWVPTGAADVAEPDDIPVLLLPGRSSGVPMWAENLPTFAEGRRVLALDALGDAGISVQSAPIAELDTQARWIDQVVNELAPDGVHVVGHSFGGATAASYAVRHPEDVRSLALLEPVFTLAYPPPGMMAWTVLASLPDLPQPLREEALGRVGGEDYDNTDPMARMIETGADGFTAALPTPVPLTEDEAARLTMPVYVAIAGRDSLAGGEDVAERAGRLLPDATVQTWPGATHSLPMQEAERLSPVLDELWSRAPAPQRTSSGPSRRSGSAARSLGAVRGSRRPPAR